MCNETIVRLGARADLGYFVVFDTRAATPEILASDTFGGATQDMYLQAKDAGDCLIAWLDNSVGIESFATIRTNCDDPTDYLGFAGFEHGTAVSLLYNGGKIGALLAHSEPELSDAAVKEIKSILALAADARPPAKIPTLGPRELAYLKKVSEGETDEEIAKDLNLSMRSVKERKKRTITELGAVNIAQAIILAKKSGQL